MADYSWTIGTGDVMMIRDTGGTVEFWFHSDTGTFNHEQPFAYTINGHTVSSTFDLPSDGAWHLLGVENVTTDQTVSFTMYDQGLGWPTSTRTVAIDRASVPSAPKPPVLTVRSSTIIELDLGADGASNGAAIDSRQYSGSSSSSGVGSGARNAVSNYQWTGLQPGVKYYFWERTHNAKGYSAWSAVASATTWDTPDAPSAVTASSLTNTSFKVTFTDGANNGSAIDDRQVGYSTTPTGSITWVDANSGTVITGLTAGTTYYLWARTHNAVGWGTIGPRSTATTLRPPDAPTTPTLSAVTTTSLRAIFSANGDGGSPITGYRIGYGTSSSAPQSYLTSDRDDVLTALTPGTTYYVWAQAQNVYGWSPLSGRATIRTVAGAWVKVGDVWKEAVPYVNVNGTWKFAQAWSRIAGVWKETR